MTSVTSKGVSCHSIRASSRNDKGPVQHSGTFNAHLVPVLAGLAFLREATKPEFYVKLQELEKQFHDGMQRIIRDHGLNMVVPHHGARFNMVIGTRTPPRRYEETFCHRTDVFLKIVRACWERGVYFHDYGGGPLHHGYSIQHSTEDKHRERDVLPLHPDLVPLIRKQIGHLHNGEPLFPLLEQRKTAQMIQADLEAAGIPYQDVDGLYADFHALRHSFIRRAWESGETPDVVMSLVGHRSLQMTMRACACRQVGSS